MLKVFGVTRIKKFMENLDIYTVNRRSITGLSQEVATGQWSVHFRKKNKPPLEISDSDAIVLHWRIGHANFCCLERHPETAP